MDDLGGMVGALCRFRVGWRRILFRLKGASLSLSELGLRRNGEGLGVDSEICGSS